MRQFLHAPLLCLFTVLITCTALAKTAKATKKIVSVTSFTEKSANATADIPAVTTLNTSTSNLAAILPLFHETNTSVAIDNSLFLQGFFYGFLLMVILVNLICYFIFSEKVFGYFGLVLTALGLLFFSADQLVSLINIDTTSINVPLVTTLLCLSMGFIALFSNGYLSTKDYFPKLKIVTIPLFISASIITLSTWFIDDTLFVVTANILSLIVAGSYFIAGILLFSKKNYAKFYVIASAIPLLFLFDYFLLNGLGIHFLNTDIINLKAAFFVEMLVMTYAIIYRMQAIKEENIIRKTEMQLFLKRQETLSRDSIAKMIEDVYLENLIMHYDLDGVEIKLLQFISEGKQNKKIARKLNTTETEIEQLTKELYHKLEISEAVKEDYKLLYSQPDYLYN